MIGNQSDLKVLSIKDYIKNPKESGYKSYHMLVSVPIFLSDSVVDTKVETRPNDSDGFLGEFGT